MKKELTLKSKTLISWALFAVVFAGLCVAASLADLQISKILTKNALPAGQYISTDGFGLFFEAMGSAPIYLMISAGALVWFWWGIRHKKVWLSVIAAILVFVGMFLAVKDAFSYVLEAMSASFNKGIPVDGGFRDKFYIMLIAAVIAAGGAVLAVFAWKQVKPETNDAMFNWLFVILGVLVCYLIVNFVKSPVGRARFRTMNAIGEGFDKFTGWWVTNGKRSLGTGLPSDNCKSFPSGHTYSAAMVYTLLCLPDMVKSWDKKWIRGLLWGLTVTFTGLVALSRIVVGAHYMSDVLFGGTLSFLAAMIFREALILKGAHFKAVFGKAKELPGEPCAAEAGEGSCLCAGEPCECGKEDAEPCECGKAEQEDAEACECGKEDAETK